MGPLEFLVILLLLGLAGGFFVARGMRGTQTFSEPRCVKCGYDLRAFRFDLDDSVRSAASHAEEGAAARARGVAPSPFEGRRCPECGADLTARHAVTFGSPVRNPKFAWIGLAGAVVAIGLLATIFMTSRAGVGIAPNTPGAMTTSKLLSDLKKPGTASQPWNWQELERRFGAGQLSAAEISESVERLITHLGSRTATGGSQPLTWVESFMQKLDTGSHITAEQYGRLAAAFYGSAPKITFPQRLRAGTQPQFHIDYGGGWNLPNVTFVKAIRDVRIDGDVETNTGAKVTAREHGASENDNDPDWLSNTGVWSIGGHLTLPEDLSPGKHELVFTIDAGVLSEPATFTAVQQRPGQKGRWPGVRHAWSTTVSVPFELLAPDDAPVELVIDESQDPLVTGTLTTPALSVRRDRNGLVLEMKCKGITSPPKLPIVATVEIKLGGKSHHSVFQRSASSSYGGLTSTFHMKSLPADATQAMIVLSPNLKMAEEDSSLTAIWGKDIRFENVPVERHDLPEASDAAASPASAP